MTKLEDLKDNIILQGIGGSQAYGTATPESDEDRLAIYLATPEQVLGFADHAKSYHFTDPSDYHLHEMEKFLALVLKGNPTIMELLWLPEHEIMTDMGEALVDCREKLMGRKAIQSAYVGYATQQLKRHGKGATDEPDEYQARRLKHLGHCYRLLLQAESFIATGTLTVRLTASEIKAIRSFAKLSYEELEAAYQEVVDHIYGMDSLLPDEPDRRFAEDFLIQARLSTFEGWNPFTTT